VTTDRRRTFHVKAFAKINLALRIVGSRTDRYHDLETTFQSLRLHDTLSFKSVPGETFRLSCDDPLCPIDDRNLVWRAAALVWRAAGRSGDPRGVRIALKKRIPMQAGLGGGSSDAAAALRGCSALWRVAHAKLVTLAAELGADVPFFLEGGTAFGAGRGDRLTRLPDHPHAWVVLLIPSFGVSTKDAYGWFDEAMSDPYVGRVLREQPLNDLEVPVTRHHPEIGRMIRALERSGASTAAMSGSGSAVYGLFSSRASATAAASALERRGRRAVVTETLGYLRYRDLSRISRRR